MRNRRLTISALALVLMAACGEDRGLNPNLVELVGTWNATAFDFTAVVGGATEDLFAMAVDPLTDLEINFYDDGTLLTITTTTAALVNLVNPAYEIQTFDVFVSGDVLGSPNPDADEDNFVGAELVLLASNINAACGIGTDPVFGAIITADITASCRVIVIDLADAAEQIVFTFTRDGDNMTITGLDEYDFGTGDEPATFVSVLLRTVPDRDRGPLIGGTQG